MSCLLLGAFFLLRSLMFLAELLSIGGEEREAADIVLSDHLGEMVRKELDHNWRQSRICVSG
jgi:hypothetical protein